MTNQEILEMLSENECRLFYAFCRESDNKELREAHAAAKLALESFARATGCHN
jgi:hypothetical protein